MLTDSFYIVLASALRQAADTAGVAIAVGRGEPAWDTGRPPVTRGVTTLVSEVARAPVAAEDVVYVNERGEPSEEPTARLRFSATFGPEDAMGTLRECGLLAAPEGGDPSRARLVSYFTHARIEKPEGMVLSRTIRLDLTPRAVLAGAVLTRFLGNVNQRELHDLERITPRCQVGEIRFDRRHYFDTVEAAALAGYDFCAFCFGSDLSRR